MAMITATTSCSRSVDCAWCPLDALCACSGRWALKGWSAAFPGGRTSSRVCRYTQVQAMVAAPGEDVSSLILDAKSTVLGQPMTVWGGLARAVPLRVLDQLLDVVADEIVVWCQHIRAGRPAAVPGGARTGDRISSPLEPAAEVRAQLED